MSAMEVVASDFSLLTYASHSEGMLPQLLQRAPTVVVGGWGQPWSSYVQKFEFVLEYARRIPSTHIIIFVDGFDTELRLLPEEAVRRFREMRVQFLISSWGAESLFPALITRRAFGCEELDCANSGMYMGYAGTVKKCLQSALQSEDSRDDDQRALVKLATQADVDGRHQRKAQKVPKTMRSVLATLIDIYPCPVLSKCTMQSTLICRV